MNARGIGVSLLVVAGLVTACAVAYAEPASTPRNRSFSIPLGVSGQPISPSSVTTGAVTATSVDAGRVITNTVDIASNGGASALPTQEGLYSRASNVLSLVVAGATQWEINNSSAELYCPFSGGSCKIGDSSDRIGAVTGHAAFTTDVGSGSNAFAVEVNGARVDIGAGASDYFDSDGTTITSHGFLATAAGLNFNNDNMFAHTNTTVLVKGQINDGASAVGVALDNLNTLSTAGSKLVSIRNNGTEKAYFDVGGTYANTAVIGTAASGTGITANYSGWVRQFDHRVTVINTALAAASTTDVTIATTPVDTRITRVVARVTQVFTGGALSAMTITCGNAAGGNQYLLSGSVFTSTTTLGDVVAEMGAGVVSATLADMGTVSAGVPGAITVSCRFTCTGANCSAATQGSVTFTVEGTTY